MCFLCLNFAQSGLFVKPHNTLSYIIPSNVKSKNAPGSTIHQAAIQVEEIFQNVVKDFRQEQIKIAKKAFRRANSQPNSTVAALISSQKKLLLLKSLVPSSATLLVVPSVLLEHWQVTIFVHVCFCCFMCM